MAAVTKSRRPANDRYPLADHELARVMLALRTSWDMRKVAIAGVLTVFAAILTVALGVTLPSQAPKLETEHSKPPQLAPLIAEAPAAIPPATAVAAPEAKPAPPFDITLNASGLLPPDQEVAAIAGKLPPGALGPEAAAMVAPDNDDDVQDINVLIDQGAFRRALVLQNEMAQREPANMLHRLGLAILYDRMKDHKNALMLYRQVVQAYDNQDDSLPPDLNIGDIRRRLRYLSATDDR